jgi:hypothetical protein
MPPIFRKCKSKHAIEFFLSTMKHSCHSFLKPSKEVEEKGGSEEKKPEAYVTHDVTKARL